VSIAIKTVNDELGLNQGWPNIQQSLTGPKFLEMAEVGTPLRKGPRQSTTTVFTFYLGEDPPSGDIVRDALSGQFGPPIKNTERVFAVEAVDGRQIAMDPWTKGIQLLWVEAESPLPSSFDVKEAYETGKPRHNGLPPRLSAKHADARPAALCRVPSWSSLVSLIEHHRDIAPPTSSVTEPFVEETNNMSEPTNLIFYGPPGTGKTYATADEAVRLCSPAFVGASRSEVMEEYYRLVDIGQIEFVTFHQSYSYEDFVEGLRPPVIDDAAGDETDGGSTGLRLELSPGVFHRIATRAEKSKGSAVEPFDLAGRQVFKMSIGVAADPDDAYLFEEAVNDGYVFLGFGEIDWSDGKFSKREAIVDEWHKVEGDIPEPATTSSARVSFHDRFRNKMKVGDVVVVSKGNTAFRAIGVVTGHYEYAPREEGGYAHRRKVDWLWVDNDGVPRDEIISKRFSMVSVYKIDPSILNASALQRYATSQTTTGPAAQFVLIIDEINRANISKVFGELITLLEPDKRLSADGVGLRVRLPYSKKMFGVPANLHVIGTMNTADRSIALLDTALRRRFQFRELMPQPKLKDLAEAGERSGVDLGKLLETINDRIEYLFDREHQIGHAYFIKCSSRTDVDNVMRQKVIPLLTEYFYEDWSRVAMVLGDADGQGRFLTRVELKPIPGSDVDAGPRYRWEVNKDFPENSYDMML
jgi:5-methylcytosine-specific restriction protein B